MTIGLGLGISRFPFDTARDYWRWVDRCEDGGVDSIWQTDRLVSKEAMLECMSTMAALAGHTEKIRFGMSVASIALRDPLLTAKQCATIDFLSDGRLLPAFGLDLFTYNLLNGGVVADATAPGGFRGTERAVNGGFAAAISVYRPFTRTDTETTGRINLDWNVTDSTLLYLSATSGYRSGGNNLVFFSATPDYDPEELLAYEFGYKTQLLDNTLQLNGSFYYYDYETIHTVATEVTPPLVLGGAPGTTTSVLPAPGAEIWGIEAEVLWLASDRWTVGGNFSYTPSEYTEDLFIQDPSQVNTPESLFPDTNKLTQNINGNQILQVPELKYTAFASYLVPLSGGSKLELFGVFSWIDDVYYSPFESETEKAESYDRTDVRATWTSAAGNWVISGFVNNIFDDIGVLQIVREDEAEFFRHSSGTTTPRLYGLEFTYSMGR